MILKVSAESFFLSPSYATDFVSTKIVALKDQGMM